MRSPERMYLEDVLGIEGYVRPVQSAVQTTTHAVRTAVVALSEVPLINGRLELLKKMLASIQIHEFIALDCTQDDSAKLTGVEPSAVLYLGENAQQLIENWAQHESLSQVTKQTTLPSLEELTDTSDASRLQVTKKQAWALLQSFQKEL
jgi:hypothetical protein